MTPAATTTDRPAGGRGRLDKRRAILDAAAEIFGEQGYERASIDAIAAQAGVSKPTVYNHFGTKEQLFRDSIAEAAAQINIQSLEAVNALEVGPTWRDSLYELAVDLVECHRSECSQSLQRQLYAEIKRDPELFRAVRARAADPMVQALAGRLAILANAGHLRLPDPTLAAKQLIALVSAEMVDLTELGARTADGDEIRRAAAAGVDTFLAAFESTRR